eukprot:GCRY01002469.1.p1 GENE.GCRY01002469.1~~GCRY01002469.1.p1  ORF type:complete len:442 (-),score=78.65 GCRY01002469.1:54-1379(-)
MSAEDNFDFDSEGLSDDFESLENEEELQELLRAAGLDKNGHRRDSDHGVPPENVYDEEEEHFDLDEAVEKVSEILAKEGIGEGDEPEEETRQRISEQINNLVYGHGMEDSQTHIHLHEHYHDEDAKNKKPRRKSRKISTKKDPQLAGNWDETLKRMSTYEQEKQAKMNQLKKEKTEAEMQEIRDRPAIVDRDVDFEGKDVLVRMEEFSALAKKRLQQKRRQKYEEEVAALRNPQISRRSRSLAQRRPETSTAQWHADRRERLELANHLREEQEIAECTFQPTINASSRSMVNPHNGDFLTRMEQDIAIRKKNREFAKQECEKEELVFQPKIGQRSAKLQMSIPVHERLYDHGMQLVIEKKRIQNELWDSYQRLEKPATLAVSGQQSPARQSNPSLVQSVDNFPDELLEDDSFPEDLGDPEVDGPGVVNYVPFDPEYAELFF